jgi:hypothetical protein
MTCKVKNKAASRFILGKGILGHKGEKLPSQSILVSSSRIDCSVLSAPWVWIGTDRLARLHGREEYSLARVTERKPRRQ